MFYQCLKPIGCADGDFLTKVMTKVQKQVRVECDCQHSSLLSYYSTETSQRVGLVHHQDHHHHHYSTDAGQ